MSLCLIGALALHAIGNSLRMGGIDAPAFELLAWAGAVVALAHVALCVATSAAMLTDTQRPPSARKRQHLVVKWVTGIALGLVAGLHIAASQGALGGVLAALSGSGVTARLLILAVVVAMGMHLWTGARSLLKDVDLPRAWKPYVRGAIVVVTLALVVVLLLL